MPAPCCLLWAGALPRPPEFKSDNGYPRFHKCPALVAIFLGLLVLLVTVTSVNSTVTKWGDNCPIRRDALDAASRAIVSPQVVEAVFEGEEPSSYTSLSPFSASFRITKVHKRYRGPRRLKKRRTVTLTFKQPLLKRPIGGKSCLVPADLKPRRKYFLFVSGASSKKENLRPVASPLPFTKKARRRIRHATCNGCAKAPSVGRLRDDSVVRGHNANLSCTFDGNPSPSVAWYKDGRIIKEPFENNLRVYTRRIRIRPRIRRLRRKRMLRHAAQHSKNLQGQGDAVQKRRKSRRKRKKKKRSKATERRPPRTVKVLSILAITASEEKDAGLYSCRGRSVVGEASAKANLTIVPPFDPGIVYPCPYDSYCLNGGTCMFFKRFGEFVCQCAEGYKGQRCQEKEVFPTLGGQNCRGPMPHGHASARGVRCPRNQPIALWELLQQTLQVNPIRKPLPWAKPSQAHWSQGRDSSWSPSRGHIIWHPMLLLPRRNSKTHQLPHKTQSSLSFEDSKPNSSFDRTFNSSKYSNYLRISLPKLPIMPPLSNRNRNSAQTDLTDNSPINGSLSFPRGFHFYNLPSALGNSSSGTDDIDLTHPILYSLSFPVRKIRHRHRGKRRRSRSGKSPVADHESSALVNVTTPRV